MRRWLAVLLCSLQSLCRAGPYLELPGVRCKESQGTFPVGGIGEPWSEDLLREAEAICDQEPTCLGIMRYIGTVEVHCQQWCGRPQFCVVTELEDTTGDLTLNRQWMSYVKTDQVINLGLPTFAGTHSSTSTAAQQIQLGASGIAAAPFRPGEIFREAACEELGFGEWQGPPVVLLSAAPPLSGISRELFPDACKVLYRPFRSTALASDKDARKHGVHGVLTENEEKDLPLFSAAPTISNKIANRNETPSGIPRFFFESFPEYPAERLNAGGGKRFILSVYFRSADSRCPGPESVSMWPDDVASQLSGRHVYIEDGTHETRVAAFKDYHFTVLCGDFTPEPFPPQAFLYSLAYGSSALVPEWMHWKASRLFFHLPDAAQGYRQLNMASMEGYFSDWLTNPAKDEVMEFKQTFMLLCQQLFWYRYRQPARQRAEVAACALCDMREKEQRRQEAATGAAIAQSAGNDIATESQGLVNATVAAVFCGMSRRDAHGLRRVVRETWGRFIAGSEYDSVQRFFVGRADSAEPLVDAAEGDVVELPVPESYRTLNIKAFSMLTWTYRTFPNMIWLIRHDDDVYLRPQALLAQLDRRAPVRYLWGNFDHGSSPVREPSHQHYNSYEQFPKQQHPVWGDIFPPYARGSLWVMSADLVFAVVEAWLGIINVDSETQLALNENVAERLPHPDDPAVGITLADLVHNGLSLNIDDRDFNSYSLNPSCNSSFSNIHNRTWVVHHVQPETMRCMWALDTAQDAADIAAGNSATDASQRSFPDLCLCSTDVEEEVDAIHDGKPFWYPRQRFNTAR